MSLTRGSGVAGSSVNFLLILDFDLPRKTQTLDFVLSFLSVFFGGSIRVIEASGTSGNGANILNSLPMALLIEA